MLALKLGMSIGGSNRPMGGWTPSDEGTDLVAWYKNKEGITLNGSDVSAWTDSSSNSHDMVQATASSQPAYNASTGVLTFDGDDLLVTTSQITLTGDFTVGLKLNDTTYENTILGDNNTTNQLIKYTNSTTLRFKTASGQVDLALDGGNTFGDDYIVLTRNSSNLKLWFNGVEQAATATKGGSSLIDTIGSRTTSDYFVGDITEVQIFSSTSSDLTTNVNNRLSTL